MPRLVAVVTARMGSTRLPGKALAEIGGRPVVAHVVGRLLPLVKEVVVAVSSSEEDAPVIKAASAAGASITVYDHVPPEDVLTRVAMAAWENDAALMVRVTGDCPLVCRDVVTKVVSAARSARCDLAQNVRPRTFARGQDVEVLWVDALARLDRLATSAEAREHVTLLAYSGDHPGGGSYGRRWRDLFLHAPVVNHRDDADLRVTLDYPEDLELLRRLEAEGGLVSNYDLTHDELVDYLRARPDLVRLNATRKTWDPH